MNISDINFSKVVFPLEIELLDVCDGDIEEFQRLIDLIGKMTFNEDFSFSDIDRLIKANWGYKKELKRSALNDRFLERILPAIKKYEVLEYELNKTYWENINVEDLIYGSYAGQMLDSLLPMREMNVRVRFNEELENLKEYIVEKVKARQTGHPSVGEGR